MGGDAMMRASRKPDIMSDAAYWILTQKSTSCTGNFFIDEDLLRNKCGVKDFDQYVSLPPFMNDTNLYLAMRMYPVRSWVWISSCPTKT